MTVPSNWRLFICFPRLPRALTQRDCPTGYRPQESPRPQERPVRSRERGSLPTPLGEGMLSSRPLRTSIIAGLPNSYIDSLHGGPTPNSTRFAIHPARCWISMTQRALNIHRSSSANSSPPDPTALLSPSPKSSSPPPPRRARSSLHAAP